MSKNENLTNQWRRTTLLDQIVEKVCTPYYRPTNKSWEITFRALGFTRSTVEDFWSVFYRINKARDGNITILEFLNYFNLERSTYIEKCFDYFDVTGEGNIDFLEFMVSVWNICTLNVDTLTRFTFDIYNLNEAGELSLPEIERMVQGTLKEFLIQNTMLFLQVTHHFKRFQRIVWKKAIPRLDR